MLVKSEYENKLSFLLRDCNGGKLSWDVTLGQKKGKQKGEEGKKYKAKGEKWRYLEERGGK
jgi:hypothetical protein